MSTNHPGKVKSKSEDCLFVDVQAPSNATVHSNLPVWLYIHGGGFNLDSNKNINGSGLIKAADYNMVVVSFNYRVGPYGFLSDGHNITPNNGLRDQRKVMEWVQKYVHHFGGNPNHVVLGGSSAGAESIALHLTANRGFNRHLFHGVTAESPSFATMLTIPEANYQYKNFAARFGCAGKDSLACLRNKTEDEIQELNYNIPLLGGAEAPNYMYLPVIDHDFIPDYQYRLFETGQFIKVPAIWGDDQNGGTKFVPSNTSTVAQSNLYMLNQYPFMSLDQLGEVNELYPNPNKTCPNAGCYWRQTSNVYGEARYMCPALYITSSLQRYGIRNSYAYLWNVEDPEQVAKGLGVPHTSEFEAIIGPEYAPANDSPDSYKAGGINAKASPVIQKYWTNFIQTLDPNKSPNKHASPVETIWTKWTPRSQDRLVFQTGGKTEMKNIGDGLRKRCAFWARSSLGMRT